MARDNIVVTIPSRLLSLYGSLEGAAAALASNPTNDALRKLVSHTLADIDRVWENRKNKP